MPTEHLASAKKFKAHADLSHFSKDWDSSGTAKIKLRLPTIDGKKEFLLAPGQVIKTKDPKAVRALENWAPPPILVKGEPWRPREMMFQEAAANSSVHVDLETIEVKEKK